MIDFTRINHVHVCVPIERLEEAKQFYANVIGLEQIHRPDVFPAPGYWFSIGDIELHIGIEDARPRTIRHSAFEVVDIEAAKAHLEQNGIEVMDEPVIPGRSRFSFFDPFGNRMELLQMLNK